MKHLKNYKQIFEEYVVEEDDLDDLEDENVVETDPEDENVVETEDEIEDVTELESNDIIFDYQNIIDEIETGDCNFDDITKKLQDIKSKYNEELLKNSNVEDVRTKALKMWSQLNK